VSMKLTPASRAELMIALDAFSEVRPPNIMVPKQIGETLRPLVPNRLYSIMIFPPVGILCDCQTLV
jgi:hypothetical protein